LFKRRKNRSAAKPDAGRARRAAAASRRLTVEEVEPWILMSADAAPALAALDDPFRAEAEVFELLEQPVAARIELVFVDDRVAADDAVLADLAARMAGGAQLEVVIIDSARDGLEQIDAALSGREDIAALHIVSHGDDGTLQLGCSVLDAGELGARAAELSGWGRALTSDADILLYGCDIGAGAGGLGLVQTLASVTGADVAASDDTTGYAGRGGDWQLEMRTGAIEADVVFSTAFQQSWQGTLVITTGATTSAATTTAQTSLTFSHTVASGADRILVVSVAISDNNTSINSVTYGGQALTFLESEVQSGGGGVKTELWYLVAPTQGTANVVVQTASAETIVAGATTFYGVDQVQPFGSPATAAGTGNSISGTISSAAGELVIGTVAVHDRPTITNGPGQTGLYGLVGTGVTPIHGGAATEPGAASVTMSGTASGGGAGGGQWALVLATIKPSGTGGNVAPVLNAARSPALSATTEDAGVPVGAVGTLVSSLVDFAVPAGQVDNVTDLNASPLLGIAITGADTANGSWWYSTDNGANWLALGAVGNSNARLLMADGATRLYFQPNANYNGSIANAITFRAWDRTSGFNGGSMDTSANGGATAFSTATDTATLVVNPVNDPPTTSPVTLAPIAEDSGPRLITQAQLLVNASDIDGGPLTASALAISAGAGTLVNNGNGTWTYTPAANDSSAVSFSYTISDGNGGTVAGSASLDITPVNDPPTTSPVTLAPIAEDSGARLITQAQLLVNANDVDGDPLTASALAISAGGGALVDNGNGTWTYTPAANDSSAVSFSYTISDGNGGSVGGTASLDITPVNDPPTTSPVALAPIAEDSGPRLITQAQLLVNANDIDGGSLTASGLAISAGAGTLVNNGNGTWTYTPAANDSSAVSFSYTISDGNGGSVAGSATLDITPVNDPPTTAPVTLAPIAEDSGPRLITQAQLLANANDTDGDPLTASGLAISAGAGTLVNNGNGTWTYTPAANDSSAVSFSYTISDGNGGTVAGSASLDITPVNDAPVLSGANDLASIAEDDVGNAGTLVSDLISGQVSDADAGALRGIAVIAVDDTNGSWQYSTNGGSTWTAFGAVGSGNARLLAADADTRVRFVPSANYVGTVANGITFHAWDQTSGTAGGTANVTSTYTVRDEFTTASYNNNHGTANWASGWIETNDTGGATSGDVLIVGGALVLENSDGGSFESIARAVDLSAATSATLTFDFGTTNGVDTSDAVVMEVSADGGTTWTTLETFTGINGSSTGSRSYDISAFASASTQIRARITNNYGGGGEEFYLNNIQIEYTVVSAGGTTAFSTATASSSVTVSDVNSAPTTTPVTLAPIAEDSGPRLLTQAELLANAADADGDALVASGLAISAGGGALVDNGNGTWTYTPAANDSSSVSFSYTIGDGNGGSVAGSATLDLTPVNDAPTTAPVTLASIAEDSGPRLITQAELLVNAADPEGDTLAASSLAISAGGGTLVDNGNGTWTYTPAANDSSSVSFSYTINDGNGGSVGGTASLDVTPVNDAPTTTPVTLAPIVEDSGPRLITQAELLANASDIEGDLLTAGGLAIASGGGTLVDNGDGTWTYTPAANDSSSVDFSYTISDGNGGSVAGSASLDITPASNNPPTTAPITLAPIAEDSGPRLITQAELLANAADADGDALVATGLAISAGGGALVDNGDGTWTYTPAADDSSSVSFSYTISDGNGGSVAGSASLDITPVNDAPTTAPVTLAPIAEDSGPRLITQAELLANASDLDGDALTASGLAISAGGGTLVDNGNGTWTYTPAANDSSSVTFSYTISDGNGGTVAGSASLDITPVNDPPTTAPVTLAPIAEDSGPRLITQAQLLVNANDIDGGPLTASALAISAGGGALVDNGDGTWTYTPAANDNSSVSFSYTIADGNGGTVAGSASLDMTPVNDAPTTTPVTLAPIAENSGARVITQAELLANAADPEGDALVASGLAISAGSGTLVDNGNGTWTYTPAANDNSSVSFSYTIADGNGGTVAGSASLDIIPVNDAPTTAPVTLTQILEDSGPRLITQAELLANASDLNGDALTASNLAITGGSGVLVDNGDGTWTYTPAADDSSSVSFSYTISDGNGGSVVGSATLAISPVNDAPIITSNGGGANAAVSLPENMSAVTTVTSTDVEGDAVQYAIAGGADAAEFRIDAVTGALVFASAPNYEAPTDNDGDNVYEVTVRVDDGQGGMATQALQIAVAGVNEAPTGGADVLDISDGQPLVIAMTRLLSNDLDVDGDALQIVSLSIPAFGSLQQDAAGNWLYTPQPGFAGTDTFTYTVADTSGRSATAEVMLIVGELPIDPGGDGTMPVGESGGVPTPQSAPPALPAAPGGQAASPASGGTPVTTTSDVLLDSILAEEAAEWPADGTTGGVESLIAEIERQRTYDARSWTPPEQYALELAVDPRIANMAGRLIALAQSASADEVARSLAVFDETFADMLDSTRRHDRQVGQVVMGSGLALSAGIVAWLLRGGALAASLFSVLPAWVSFDPIPILVAQRGPTRPRAKNDASEAAVARVLRADIRRPPSARS
jgi:outer membrane lipoprotein-sorting protein